MKSLVLTVTLLLPLVLGLALPEDDIVFEGGSEEEAAPSPLPIVHRKEHETSRIRSETKKHRVERFLAVPDVAVTVGHVLKLKIPKLAFSGSIDHYEVKNSKVVWREQR